jgi:hypothetical protein
MQFVINIISSTKFSEKLSDDDLMKAFHERFEGGVPLKNIDCVFVHSLEHKEIDESMVQDGLTGASQ